MISRLPIRLRLALPFAVVMAALLALTGFLIYQRVGSELLSTVDRGLRAQSVEAAHHVSEGHGVLDRDAPEGPAVGQLLLADGRIRESRPASVPALVSGSDFRDVLAGQTRLRSGRIRGLSGEWRILAAPARVNGAPAVIVLSASLASRDQTLDRLVREFLLWGALALAIATVAGYLLAASALRPVEAMRRRAASIGASTPGARLPLPRSRDEISRLAETLNEMLARLESAVEHERRFVDDASHELRTPLALLRGELELALRHPRSKEELERGAALRRGRRRPAWQARGGSPARRPLRPGAPSAARRARRRGCAPPRRSPVGSRVAPGRPAAPLHVEPSGGLTVEGDSMRLEQALDNLVENAFVYGAGSVVLAAVADDGRVELHVEG